jgi:hypothetical protein
MRKDERSEPHRRHRQDVLLAGSWSLIALPCPAASRRCCPPTTYFSKLIATWSVSSSRKEDFAAPTDPRASKIMSEMAVWTSVIKLVSRSNLRFCDFFRYVYSVFDPIRIDRSNRAQAAPAVIPRHGGGIEGSPLSLSQSESNHHRLGTHCRCPPRSSQRMRHCIVALFGETTALLVQCMMPSPAWCWLVCRSMHQQGPYNKNRQCLGRERTLCTAKSSIGAYCSCCKT